MHACRSTLEDPTFTLVVAGTLILPRQFPEATSAFFVFGALFLLSAAALNLALTIDLVRESRAVAAAARQAPLVFIQQYGFNLMFIAGVATRAVPTLSGRARPQRSAQIVAVTLTIGVIVFVWSTLRVAYGNRSDDLARGACFGLLIIAASLGSVVWLSGVFHPRANRVAAASQQTFWFVRSAMAWLAVQPCCLPGTASAASLMREYRISSPSIPFATRWLLASSP